MIAGALSRRAGGLFWSVRRLSQALAETGADVHVFGLRDPDIEADLPAWAPLEPVVLDRIGPAMLGYAPGLGQALAECAPDIVHLHGIWLALSRDTARWAARGGKLMISPRGMLDPWAMANSAAKKRIAWYSYERANLRHATCVHALNASEAGAVRRVLPKSAIATIPNGIDISQPDLPIAPRPADRRPQLLFISRIHPKKGLIEFLDHWAAIRTRLSRPWMLRIAGPDEGGHLAALKTRVQALGLVDSVAFTGPVFGNEKARALSEATAFVLPSKSEGLPMAVLEAWAAGLPVLMTRACNLPEGFDAGAAIELTDEPGPLLAALERTDLAAMGARGRELVQSRFGWAGLAQRHLSVYSWMLQNQSEASCPPDVQQGCPGRRAP